MNIRTIFQWYQDVDVSITVGEKSEGKINRRLMSEQAFVSIVTNLLKSKTNGENFKNLEDLREYYGIK